MAKVLLEKRALNQVWKGAYFHTVESVLSLFGRKRVVGLLGVVVSRKDRNIKNCIAFYGRVRKQAYSRFAAECKRNLYHPNLHSEYFIEILRFDDGVPRKSRYIITE